jgi:hypothetical protein
MKVQQTHYLVREGPFAQSEEFIQLVQEVHEGIRAVHWPPGNDQFILHPEKQGNGVKPIKVGCMDYLYEHGWRHEKRMKIMRGKHPGKVDAVKTLSDGREFVVEWETGNISSSHRALNKMAVGLLEHAIIAGILILPTREMYQYLTDRVGNYRELEPYFTMYEHLDIQEGVLAVIAIEHDSLSSEVPKIEKGTDGRALR